MTMIITLSLLGLEGHTPSSLEDDGIGHGHLHNSFTEETRKVAMVILLLLRDMKGRTPLL